MKITLEELLFRIEQDFDNEGLQSNQWEDKYDLNLLKTFLGKSFIQIGNLVYIQMEDSLYQVNYRTYEAIDSPFETIDLFELDDFNKVNKDMVKEQIKNKLNELKQLGKLLDELN